MKNILLIAASAVMILASCSKDKETTPSVKITPHVYVKTGQSVYTVQLRTNSTVNSSGTVTVSWTSDSGSLSRVTGVFNFSTAQVTEFTTTVSKNQWSGVNNVKIETISGSGGYNFTY